MGLRCCLTFCAVLSVALLNALPASAAPLDPARLVVIGGDLTEIVYALGAGRQVVGVDTTSNFPPEAAALETVGYMRRLSAEGVLSLEPDLVLAAADAGPDAALAQLRAAGVAIAIGPDNPSPEGVLEKIAFVGDALGREAMADALAQRIQADMGLVRAAVSQLDQPVRAMFILSVRGGALMAAGGGTSADAMITLSGGANAVSGFEGYKPLSAEIAIAAAPEVIIAPAHAAKALGGLEAIKARPELVATPAVETDRVLIMDGMLLLGFGPRTPQAVAELASLLHVDFKLPELTGRLEAN
ncbi:MAG: ABC transporter substrate-binding protein [Rhodobacteraceae bacterium]|nr:ABC transporter substrate-binding protein [Paracoccaceae bacterium]